MMELIFVIVVIGILAAVFIPRIGRNNLSDAANQLISHIRYTQHLALMDDKYDKNDPKWYNKRWELAFSTAASSQSYYIFSDSPSLINQKYDGNPGANSTYTKVEVAKNPSDNSLYLLGVPLSSFDNSNQSKLSKNLNLTSKYGIKNIVMTGGNSATNNRILFDHLGRPYRGSTAYTVTHPLSSPVDGLIRSRLYIKLCSSTCSNPKNKANNSNELVIIVEPETGYVHLL